MQNTGLKSKKGAFFPEKPTKPPNVFTPEPPPSEGVEHHYTDEELAEMAAGWPKEDS